MFEFEWDIEKERKNLFKHGIGFNEASTIFDDPFACYYEDFFHSLQENRYIVRGYSNLGNLLIVCFTYRTEIIRIINARSATKKERKQHEK